MSTEKSSEKPTGKAVKDKARSAGLGGRLWSFFSSVKLTLTILMTLAVVSIFGTVIQQKDRTENYIMEYGEQWTSVIRALSLDDMYHSTWFTGILILLCVNIVVCTFERFPPKWRTLLNETSAIDTGIIKKLSNRHSFTTGAGRGEVNDSFLALLGKKGYKIRTEESDGANIIYAWRGKLGRFGSDFTHISLLVILLGAIIGSKLGYNDFRAIYVGGTIEVPDSDFHLRLDKFWIEYYDTGQIQQYNSNLTVIEDGKEILTKQIWVNEPLLYKGIRFYQSSYGMAWNELEETELVAIKVVGEDIEVGDPVKLKWSEKAEVPGSPYSARVISYVSDFAYDEELGGVTSKSAETNNPAVRVEIYKGDSLISTPWLFFNYQNSPFAQIPNSDYMLVFSGYRSLPYSGISINKDPGTNVVWFGSIIMGLGTYFSFFVFYRRLWVRIEDKEGATEVSFGGMINKNTLIFEREFKELIVDARGAAGATVEDKK